MTLSVLFSFLPSSLELFLTLWCIATTLMLFVALLRRIYNHYEWYFTKIIQFFFKDKVFACQAMKSNLYDSATTSFLPQDLINDEDFILEVIKDNPGFINKIESPLFTQADFIRKALKVRPETYRNLNQYMVALPDNTKKSLLKTALKDNFKLMGSLNYSDLTSAEWSQLINDKPSILSMKFKEGSSLFKNLSWDENFSKQRLKFFLENDGMILNGLSSLEQLDKDLVMAAVKQNGLAIQYADQMFHEDPDVIKAALTNNFEVLKMFKCERSLIYSMTPYELYMNNTSGVANCIRFLLIRAQISIKEQKAITISGSLFCDLVCHRIGSFLTFLDVLTLYNMPSINTNKILIQKEPCRATSELLSIYNQNLTESENFAIKPEHFKSIRP